MNFNCPKAKNKFNTSLEICAARKARRQHGCVTCRAPAQKRREKKELDQKMLALEIVRGAIRATPKKREWAFKVLGA